MLSSSSQPRDQTRVSCLLHLKWGSLPLAPPAVKPYLNPGGSDGEESACSVGDLGLIPGSGKLPGEGNFKDLHKDRTPATHILQSWGLGL